MAKLSKPIQIPGTEAVRVRLTDGDRVELLLIDQSGSVQSVPVQMECERMAAEANRAAA